VFNVLLCGIDTCQINIHQIGGVVIMMTKNFVLKSLFFLLVPIVSVMLWVLIKSARGRRGELSEYE